MKQATIAIIVTAILVILGGWAYFSASRGPVEPLSEAQQRVLDVQDDRLTKGSPDAPVKMVEYADILCPYCAKAHEDVIAPIEDDYIAKDQLHYEVRLIATIAPDSERAAEGAYCAAEQNKFWPYLDKAYADSWNNHYSQNESPQDVEMFGADKIVAFADSVGVNLPQWQKCMDDGEYKAAIAANQAKMSELQAYGTPHFIINGANYNGAPPYASFKAVIDAELNKVEANR